MKIIIRYATILIQTQVFPLRLFIFKHYDESTFKMSINIIEFYLLPINESRKYQKISLSLSLDLIYLDSSWQRRQRRRARQPKIISTLQQLQIRRHTVAPLLGNRLRNHRIVDLSWLMLLNL